MEEVIASEAIIIVLADVFVGSFSMRMRAVGVIGRHLDESLSGVSARHVSNLSSQHHHNRTYCNCANANWATILP